MSIFKLNKRVTLPLLLFIGGLICIGLFKATGSTLDADGFLHEYFALLPLGFMLIGSSVFVSIVNCLRKSK